MNDEELKKLFDEQGLAFDAFKKANNERLSAIEAKSPAATDLTITVENCEKELTRIAAEIKELKLASTRPGTGNDELPDIKEHKEVIFGFDGYMRKGNIAKLERIQNTLRTSSDPDSGYFLPNPTVEAIERIASANNAMRQLATVTPTGGGGSRQAVVISGVASGWTGETATKSTKDTPKISEVKIEPEECYTNLPAFTKTLEDSAEDLEAWLINEAGFSFADLEGAGFITGTGVNSPRGIMSYTFTANTSYSWGSVGYVVSGKSGAFADTNPGDYLINLVHALKPRYRLNGAFLMNDTTLSKIRKFQTGMGDYLWQPGLQADVPDRLLGKRVEIDDNIADISSSSYSIAFGDWRQAYRIVDRRGITMLRDPYTTKGLVYFYLTKRVGGGVKNFEAYKVMKFSA